MLLCISEYHFSFIKIILHGRSSITCTQRHTHRQLLPAETRAGCLSVLPRGESQWGAAFSSCMCKCHAVSLQHLGKSTEEKLRVQPRWLLWRRCATGYNDEVKKITLGSQAKFINTKMDCVLCELQEIHKSRYTVHTHWRTHLSSAKVIHIFILTIDQKTNVKVEGFSVEPRENFHPTVQFPSLWSTF